MSNTIDLHPEPAESLKTSPQRPNEAATPITEMAASEASSQNSAEVSAENHPETCTAPLMDTRQSNEMSVELAINSKATAPSDTLEAADSTTPEGRSNTTSEIETSLEPPPDLLTASPTEDQASSRKNADSHLNASDSAPSELSDKLVMDDHTIDAGPEMQPGVSAANLEGAAFDAIRADAEMLAVEIEDCAGTQASATATAPSPIVAATEAHPSSAAVEEANRLLEHTAADSHTEPNSESQINSDMSAESSAPASASGHTAEDVTMDMTAGPEEGKKRRRALDTSKLGRALSDLESALNAWDNVEVTAEISPEQVAAVTPKTNDVERMKRTKELLQELRKQLADL